MNCPLLIRDTHFEVTPRWPLRLIRDVVSEQDRDLGATYEFFSGDQLLATWHRRQLVHHKGFACDGYSPVITVFGRHIRLTPTPRCGFFPSVDHDLKRQILVADGCPWTREETDLDFYNSLVAGGTHPHVAGTYYGTVGGSFGTLYIRATRKPDPSLRIIRTPYP